MIKIPSKKEIQEKIKYLIHEEKLSRREIADRLGYKHEDYITHLARGIRNLPEKKVPLLNELISETREKVVITCSEIVPGEYDKQTQRITKMFIDAASEEEVSKLEEFTKKRAEEITEEKEKGTPGLYYFKIFITKESTKKINKFFEDSDEKIVGIFPLSNINKALAAMLATMHEGVNQTQYARDVIKILQELKRSGKI